MTFKELKIYIANSLERDQNAFIDDNFDALSQAISNALCSIQRQHDFEWLKTHGYVTFPQTNKWTIGEIIDEATDAPMSIKKVERIYRVVSGGAEVPVRLVGRETEFDRELERTELNMPNFYGCPITMEKHGRLYKALNAPKNETLRFRFDVVRWLPPFVSDNDSNFISEVAPDVLLYHALAELNLFMKESDQVQLSSAFYNARWKSLLAWDADQFENVAQDIFE